MEYFAFITGLLYLVLEIRQNSIMWVVGVISAMAYIIVFAESSLFADPAVAGDETADDATFPDDDSAGAFAVADDTDSDE